jgi:hypothetical protein
LAIGAMLAQNLTINIILIMYAYHLLNKVECNYTNIEHETLTMVCGFHKLKHYMLGNKFVFYVDHMALIYLDNKTQDFGRIARRVFLFLEYVLSYFYKPRKIHVMVNASSRIHDVYELVNVLDLFVDTTLFVIELAWIQVVTNYL